MTTQLVVKIDKGLKERVAKKAHKQYLSLSDFVKMTFHAYDEGRIEPGIMQVPERFNAKTRRILNKRLKDLDQGKNMVGPFKTTAEMDAYLDSL